MILTNDKGVPYVKPSPDDYPTTAEFLHAFWAYKDAIAADANRAFDEQFRKSIHRGR